LDRLVSVSVVLASEVQFTIARSSLSLENC
jgi:hypothetical protein